MISFGALASKVFGSANDRRVKSYSGRVEQINALEEEIAALSDEQLRARTEDFRRQLRDGAKLDSLLVPAFATVREAAKRTLHQRHFDVQLIGGMVLHEGKIAEMKTGEGKTLVATLAVYLNALTERGVHVVTVNDYLARRDSAWMGQVYRFLGLSVGCIVNELDDDQRREAYACDVTYGTNNEFGFDYLRDNMKMSKREMVQRSHYFAIVDEVDSILIDEARTPLIISGPVEDRAELYNAVDAFMPELVSDKERFELDEKQRQVSLTEAGNEWIEHKLAEAGMMTGSLYDIENVTIVHHVNQALKAHKLFQRDRDYIVRNGEVMIIDEFTGRMMPGRRYSEGLHQALEAKEHVEIQPENQTLASITFQNYFRLYEKLAGMTGTAATEASEFMDIYGLDVLEIPTHRPVARLDEDDEIYRTEEEKWEAIIDEIEDAQRRRQPVLVGTASIEKSELLSGMLKEKGIKHQVLNARYHEQEAKIIAEAGVPGTVTIATNMAGRGTDIQLGGNLEMHITTATQEMPDGPEKESKIKAIEDEIKAARDEVLTASEEIEIEPAKGSRPAKTLVRPGGLYVIGTERHESRRIDNQLRGRSGRQGDPGRSKFYLSLQDDLMRIFGSERMDSVLKTLGLQRGEAISHSWMNKSLEMAQKKVEARNFDIRKQILKYDDVMNDQRKVIFEQRLDIMAQDDVSQTIQDMRDEVIQTFVSRHVPEKAYAEQWDIDGLKKSIEGVFGFELPLHDWTAEEGIADEEMRERIKAAADEAYKKKHTEIGQVVLDNLRGARDLLAFAEQDALIQEYLQNPAENLEALGRHLLRNNGGEIRVNGDLKRAEEEVGTLGYAFLSDYSEAKALQDYIGSLDDQSPEAIGGNRLRDIEKSVLLQTLDHLWREHLVTLEHLREVIGFRAFGQRDPLNEYKTESFVLFEAMLDKLREAVTGQLMHLEATNAEMPDEEEQTGPTNLIAQRDLPESALAELALVDAAIAGESRAYLDAEAAAAKAMPLRTRQSVGEVDPNDPATWGKVSRNAQCPCGSGKKYKHCHGRH